MTAPGRPFVDPFEVGVALWEYQVQAAFMLAEAQAVIAYRTLGMMGLWPVSDRERRRMLSEKPPAFAAAVLAASLAAARGNRPDQIMSAAMRPIRRRTRANARRLGRGR